MSARVRFQGSIFKLQLTFHAGDRIRERSIGYAQLVQIIELGKVMPNAKRAYSYWVFADIQGRIDNSICLSAVIEGEYFIIKTVMINWRPQ